MRYQDCIFDLYGTLVDIHTDENRPGLWEEMARWYGSYGAAYSAKALHSAYLRTIRQMEAGSAPLRRDSHEAHPEIQIEAVFQRLFQEKGAAADETLSVRTGQHFREWSLAYIRLYDGAAELLKALRRAGMGVWLLSNAQRIFTALELRQLGIEDLFDGIYLSSDYGCKKPDRRFFDILLQERGICPASAVMIGNDGICDIQGAQAAGLATVYIRSNISPAEPLPEADFVLEQMDLKQVQGILTDG